MLSLHVMLLLGGLFALALGSVSLIVYNLRRAPEGYEDEDGFHIYGQRARGSRILSTKKHGAQGKSVASLKQIKA